ncbi:MAG: hypothetical protein FWD34_07245 [Oscillospiraceae bacterium]|nr:hypothetical protein [Oscillospiraceae bacterium]
MRVLSQSEIDNLLSGMLNDTSVLPGDSGEKSADGSLSFSDTTAAVEPEMTMFERLLLKSKEAQGNT